MKRFSLVLLLSAQVAFAGQHSGFGSAPPKNPDTEPDRPSGPAPVDPVDDWEWGSYDEGSEAEAPPKQEEGKSKKKKSKKKSQK